jgi:O-antigen ligase
MKLTALNKTLIVILIGIIPILWSNKTIDPNITIQYIGLAILLIGFILINKNLNLNIDLNFSLIFIFYIIYSIIPLSISNNTADGIFVFSQFILLFYLTLIFFQFKNPDILFTPIAQTAVVVSLLILIPAFFQLIELISDQDLTIPQSTYKIKSIFSHRNLLSHFLLLIFPFCVYLFFVEKKIWRYAALSSTCLALFLIIILSNRTSWISLILVFISTISILFIKKKVFMLISKVNWIFAGVMVLILASALFFHLKFSDTSSLKSHALQTFDYHQGSTKDRLELWKRTIILITEKPFIGHGLGSWKINILKYGNEGLASENNITFYQRPHNDFLWIAAEQGLLGFILYLSIFLMVLLQILKAIRSCKKSSLMNQLMVYLSVLICFLVISIFNFPKERIGHNIILFSNIGLFLNLKSTISENKQYKILNYKGLKYASLLLLTIILVFGFKRYQGEFHTKNAIIARKKGEYRNCIIEIEKAQSFIYKIDETSTPLAWQAGLSYFNLNDYDKANSYLKEATEINPYHIYVLNDYASSLTKLHKYNQAIENYKKALSISPNFLDARLNLCALYYTQENYYNAFDLLKGINLTHSSERLNKTIILVTRKILDMELSDKQPHMEFLHLYQKEYDNLSFYKGILEYIDNTGCKIEDLINKPNSLLTLIKK